MGFDDDDDDVDLTTDFANNNYSIVCLELLFS